MRKHFLLLGFLLALAACSAGPAAPTTTTTPPATNVDSPTPTTTTEPANPAAPSEVPQSVRAEEAPPPPPPSTTTWTHLAPVAGCSRSAVVYLIDRSGSMSGVPIDMAKKSALIALASLTKDDCFGVIVFDSFPTRIVALSPVIDRAPMEADIARIDAGGGTEIFQGLDAAFKDVMAATATTSHRGVILLTDGQSPQKGIADLTKLMAREHVVISTIGLGGAVDRTLLQNIADVGGGRMTLLNDPNALPQTVSREVALLSNPSKK